MRPLSLDFQRASRLPRVVGGAALALGLAAAMLAGADYRTLSDEIAWQEEKLAVLERTTQRKPQRTRQNEQEIQRLGVEIRHAKEVVRDLSLPWDGLFLAVESAAREQVALLTIEPDAQKEQVKITGEAKDFYAMLAYWRALKEESQLADVYLQTHQIQQQDPDNPIRFAVAATWRNAP